MQSEETMEYAPVEMATIGWLHPAFLIAPRSLTQSQPEQTVSRLARAQMAIPGLVPRALHVPLSSTQKQDPMEPVAASQEPPGTQPHFNAMWTAPRSTRQARM